MRRMKSLLLLLCIFSVLLPAAHMNELSNIVLASTPSFPLAAFTYFPCVMCAVPGDLVMFQGNWSLGTSGKVVNYTWDFGDGNLASMTTPFVSHDYYGYPGQWVVTLTVEDSNGFTDSVRQLVLFDVIPRFTFTPAFPLVGQQVSFNASQSISYNQTAPIVGYFWSFGDGTSGTGEVVSHSYSASGPHRVALTLETASGNPSISKTLTVGQVSSVGGQALPSDTLNLLLPFIATLSILTVAILSAFYITYKKTWRRERSDPKVGSQQSSFYA